MHGGSTIPSVRDPPRLVPANRDHQSKSNRGDAWSRRALEDESTLKEDPECAGVLRRKALRKIDHKRVVGLAEGHRLGDAQHSHMPHGPLFNWRPPPERGHGDTPFRLAERYGIKRITARR